eukprot:scaffold31883_cov33-Phaeocystis_antarctica.AAC.1
MLGCWHSWRRPRLYYLWRRPARSRPRRRELCSWALLIDRDTLRPARCTRTCIFVIVPSALIERRGPRMSEPATAYRTKVLYGKVARARVKTSKERRLAVGEVSRQPVRKRMII